MVSFDKATQLANDMLTRLTFYRDGEYQDMIPTMAGRCSRCSLKLAAVIVEPTILCINRFSGNRFDSFVVPSDRFWFKFTAGPNNE